MLATAGIYVCKHKSKAQPHDVAPDSVVTPYSIATVAKQCKPLRDNPQRDHELLPVRTRANTFLFARAEGCLRAIESHY